jgi:hypothetical protein
MFKDLEAAVQSLQVELLETEEKTLQEAGQFAVKMALNTNKFRVSSTFRAATKFHQVTKTTGFVLADKPYAEYLEFGNNAKGAYIYPRVTKALHWISGGKDIFVKKVRSHPGYYFMENAGQQLDANMEKIFLDNLNKTLKGE